jgi:hypothetical protein
VVRHIVVVDLLAGSGFCFDYHSLVICNLHDLDLYTSLYPCAVKVRTGLYRRNLGHVVYPLCPSLSRCGCSYAHCLQQVHVEVIWTYLFHRIKSVSIILS